jgi:redox-sensitive bicupin YhaK (pirin superfamily)
MSQLAPKTKNDNKIKIPRKVERVIEPQYVIEGADVLLRRSFGPNRTNLFDPFLLFDHFAFNDPLEGPIRGFPTHPHRGIETVTYMLDGNVRHRDSIGNSGVIGPGDVQWMTSGRGILHEEMPRRGASGKVLGFQLWVNLPAAQKMGQPRYQEVKSTEIPVAEKPGVKVRLVAGELGEFGEFAKFDGVRGPVTEIAAKPLYIDVTLEPGRQIDLPVPEGHTLIAYVFEGEGWFGLDGDAAASNSDPGSAQGELIQAVRMAVFDDGDHLSVRASETTPVRFMLMAGAPFKEPIFPYGPFVMNTQEEIQQALMDLRNGTFVQN